MKKTSAVLVGVWLILESLLPLLNVEVPHRGLVLALFGTAAGVAVIVEAEAWRLSSNIGLLLLGIWLILIGLMRLLEFSFPYSSLLVPALGVAAGVLLLLRK